MERNAVKGFFTRAPAELLDDKLYKLVVSQDFTQSFVHDLIIISLYTVPVTHFKNNKPKKTDVIEASFKQDMSREICFKEKITPQ